MLLDKLKEFESTWDEEHLSSISADELLSEVKSSYNKIYPIDYVVYGAIPDNVAGIILESSSDENNIISKNPFYEKLLLQILYMESKGLDSLYGRAIVGIVPAAQAAFELDRLLSFEPEYQYLVKVYNSYIDKSFSFMGSQIQMLNQLTNINKEDLEKTIESLKGIVKPEEA